MEDKQQIKVLILAGGEGKRMQSELPKVLSEINGKPMVKWVLEAIKASGVDPRPTIIVGYKKELVMEALGDGYDYVVQDEQLGTGHAVMMAEKILSSSTDNILILAGDNPLITGNTLKKIAEKHLEKNSKVTMGTVTLSDFLDWRKFFYTNFSRIIRGADGHIIKSVEFKDANEEEKQIKEVNPIYLCFENNWLWENLKRLNTDNAQKEYYLTDLIKIATTKGTKIESVDVDPLEALAANSKEELELIESLTQK